MQRLISFITVNLLSLLLFSSLGYSQSIPVDEGAGTGIGGFDEAGNYNPTGTWDWTLATIIGLLTAESDTQNSVQQRGKESTVNNSLANAARFGAGVNPVCIWEDALTGARVDACNPADKRIIIHTDHDGGFFSEEHDEYIEKIDPDAATPTQVWTYPITTIRPKKTVWFGAGSLSTDGTQCAAPAEVTINSGAKRWTIICADNNGSTIWGEVSMPKSWDGGTVTFAHHYIQTAADTGILNGDISASCRLAGATINNTWGTEVAIDDAAVTGSNALDITTSAAVTPNGTCTPGTDRILQFQYQLDTATTTAVATLHHIGFKMEYTVTSRSD